MASEAELLALAERCEKAEGPNRYLDYDIALAVLLHLEKIPASKWMYEATGAKHEMFTVMFDDGARRYMYSAEPYTASLDAAMSLVPEGLWAEGSLSSPGQLEVHGPCTFDPIGKGWAATPALALTAACLRARAATMGGSDD